MAGAPGPNTMLHVTKGLDREQQAGILRIAHGIPEGQTGPKVSYDPRVESDFQLAFRNAKRVIRYDRDPHPQGERVPQEARNAASFSACSRSAS